MAPCNYSFPVDSTEDFLDLASLILSTGTSSTISLAEKISITDPGLSKLVASILAVESRHAALIQSIQGDNPIPAPFETGGNRIWAYNLALSFIIPGSCPSMVPLPILPMLSIGALAVPATNCTLELRTFSWDPDQRPFTSAKGKQLFIAWVNQIDKPIYTTLNITAEGHGIANQPQEIKGVVFTVISVEQYIDINDLAIGGLTIPAVVFIS